MHFNNDNLSMPLLPLSTFAATNEQNQKDEEEGEGEGEGEEEKEIKKNREEGKRKG